MLNGDNIGGNISTSQLSIVPKPGDLNIYYIFVADAFAYVGIKERWNPR